MTWNYRIVRFKDKKEEFFQVQEVYYDKKGLPTSCCEATISGETIEACFKDLFVITKSMSKNYLKFPEDFKKDDTRNSL